jgi:hypothetical protein
VVNSLKALNPNAGLASIAQEDWQAQLLTFVSELEIQIKIVAKSAGM